MKVRPYLLMPTIALASVGLSGCFATPTPAASNSSSAAAEEPTHWTYAGASGPSEWGVLDSEFAACGTGSRQSPIDLPVAVPATGDDVRIAAEGVEGELVDTGHTMQFVPDSTGSIVDYGGVEYSALQTHFHAPSEHTIAGEPAAAEFHLVHSDDDGNLFVVGVLVTEGAASEAWAPYVDAVSEAADEDQEIDLDVSDLLPADLEHYAYTGSLTTPPCTEGVQWIVLSQPVEL
jgi:carbonic anhydrase